MWLQRLLKEEVNKVIPRHPVVARDAHYYSQSGCVNKLTCPLGQYWHMWKSLKQILQDSKDKAVIIEDGEPRYVILSFDEYMRLRGDTSVDPPEAARDTPADLAMTQEETRSGTAPHLKNEEINLEDLPF